MDSSNLAKGMFFSIQTTVGLLGNFSFLYHYFLLYHTGCRFRSTDLILNHLTVANLLVILSKGVPQTMDGLGLKDFLNEFGCKFLFYLHKVGRDVSLGTTSLLSVFQAIIISPIINFRWAELKVKACKYMGTCNNLCWILTLIFNIIVPVHMADKCSYKNTTKKHDYGYCCAIIQDKIKHLVYVPLLLFRDVLWLVLMLWASSYMVLILYRHKQQVRHLHRTSVSSRLSPESTATQTILVLVCIFASLSTLSSVLHLCLAVSDNSSLWLANTSTLIAGCFPTVSPYILMSHDSRASTFCFVRIRNTKSRNLVRHM